MAEINQAKEQIIQMIQAKMIEDGGLSIRQAAAQMKLSPGALSNILTGEREIGAEAAIRIAQYLRIPSADILRMVGQHEFLNLIQDLSSQSPSQPLAPTVYRAAQELNGLTANQLNAIITLARTFKESNLPAPISDTATPTTYPTKRDKKQ